ncbi:MAG: hypothetical protein M3A44_13180 [Gammaproteobacteria bacterium]
MAATQNLMEESTMYQTESTFEFNPEAESFEAEQFEFGQSEWAGESGEVFNEAELMELTAELMEITSEQELNYFLGKLVKRAAGAIGKVVRSPVGQAIGGALKAAAKKALPIAGAALGGVVGGPLGAQIGSGLAQAAGGALGLEAEALSYEDREYEGGKQFVRFAGETVKNAVTAPTSPDPKAAAQSAAVRAAQSLAPGLLSSAQSGPASRGASGRWVRRGRHIVILNA